MTLEEYEIEWLRTSNDDSLDWKAKTMRHSSLAFSYVNELLASTSIEELRKQWFIDYGAANSWDEKDSAHFRVASNLHEIDAKHHPKLHEKMPQKHSWHCWHEDNCSCGLCHSWDSSD